MIGNDEYQGRHARHAGQRCRPDRRRAAGAQASPSPARAISIRLRCGKRFANFSARSSAAGPDAVALVYLAGFGLQFEGENYFVPVDADIQRDVDVPLQAIRISDFTQPLAALPGRVKIVILDAARQNPFARGGQPLASGLALVDPAPSMAIAFNAAPGTVAPDEQGPYGAYATVADGNDRSRRAQPRRHVRARSSARQRADARRRSSLVRVADRRPVLHDRARRRRAAAAKYGAGRRYPQQADARLFGNPDDAYAAALDARHDRRLSSNSSPPIPDSPYAAPRRRDAGRAPRRDRLAPLRDGRHAAGLLVLSAPLSERAARLGCAPAAGDAWRAGRSAADFAMFDFGVPPPPPTSWAFSISRS